MSQALMRRFATVAASAVLLSGAAAMAGGQAFAAPAGEHPGHHAKHVTHVHYVKKTVERWSWDQGVDKRKDKWDARHHCWTRYDSESRSNAQWDEKHHCWTRSHHGHMQKWDNKHHCWK